MPLFTDTDRRQTNSNIGAHQKKACQMLQARPAMYTPRYTRPVLPIRRCLELARALAQAQLACGKLRQVEPLAD